MKRIFTKILSLFLSAVIIISAFCVIASAAGDDITITNPYSGIDWDNVNQYKTALHCHTNASDGDYTLKQVLERHVETGFDAVAVTDHGDVDDGWATTSGREFPGKTLQAMGRSKGNLEYLGDSGEFADGITYTYSQGPSGDYYLKSSNGSDILRIPYGIENNAVSANAHVNSWFVKYQNNNITDYEQCIKDVDKLGGLSVINHPGEYTQARYELYTDDAYNLSNASYKYYFQKFYGLIMKYPSCIGIDINSKGDGRTRYERKLWDEMLTEAAKSGRTVTAIASSDAHQLNKIDTGSTIVLADEKTSASFKDALSKGHILPQSTCIANVDELIAYNNAIKEFYGETSFTKQLDNVISQYEAERDKIAKTAKKSNVGVSYTSLDSDGYFNKNARVKVDSIEVDDNDNTITINSENALIVRFISGGKQIAVVPSSDGKIDLDDYKDELSGYVRAEIFGEGGVVYTESFTINAEQNHSDSNPSYFNLGSFDFIFSLLNSLFERLGRFFKSIC